MFADMKLSSKLAIAFGIMLAMLLLSTSIAFMTTFEASEGFKQYRDLARDTGLASRLQANMLMVRMNVKDFIITGSDKDLQEYSNYLNKITGFLAKAQNEIQDPERAALVNSVQEQIQLYDGYFKQVKKFQTQRDALEHEALNVLGPRMEEKLTLILLSAEKDSDFNTAFHSGLAIRNLLLARLYVVKFLETNAEADIERVKAEWTKLHEVFADLKKGLHSPAHRELLADVEAASLKYYKILNQVFSSVISRNNVMSEHLNQMGPTIASEVEKIKLSTMADTNTLGPQLQAANDSALIKMGSIAILALLFGIILAILVTRSVLKLLGNEPRELSVVAERISQGDLDITFSAHCSGVYGNMQRMTQKLRELIAMTEQKTADAEKESGRARVAMQEAEEARRQAENAKREGMLHAATQLEGIVDGVTYATKELSQLIQEATSGSNVQRERAAESATAIEEMNATVLEVARNAGEAAEYAASAREQAEEGATIVTTVVESIGEVKDRSSKLKTSLTDLGNRAEGIESVMTVISDIADQTNLLALNAAIEAARAGEAGRGFAVVADEVRKLAEKTMLATTEVDDAIRAIQKASQENIEGMDQASIAVDHSTNLAQQSGHALRSIVDTVIANSDQVSSIATASEQQSAASEQISRGSEEINHIATETAESMVHAANSVQKLSTMTSELNNVITQLKNS